MSRVCACVTSTTGQKRQVKSEFKFKLVSQSEVTYHQHFQVCPVCWILDETENNRRERNLLELFIHQLCHNKLNLIFLITLHTDRQKCCMFGVYKKGVSHVIWLKYCLTTLSQSPGNQR